MTHSSRSAVLSGAVLTVDGFASSSAEVAVISEEDVMDISTLPRQGKTLTARLFERVVGKRSPVRRAAVHGSTTPPHRHGR